MANPSSPHFRSPPDWENPAVYGINKRAAHVTLRSYSNPREAFEDYKLYKHTSHSSRRLYLNSFPWCFKLFEKPSDTPDDFYKQDYDARSWDEVRKIFLYS